jgi:hypothetical protein
MMEICGLVLFHCYELMFGCYIVMENCYIVMKSFIVMHLCLDANSEYVICDCVDLLCVKV